MRLTPLIFTLSLCAIATTLHAADPVGMRKISVVTQDYPRPLAVTVWYPSKGDGQVAQGDDRIFQGNSAAADAAIRDGRFPLVLLSHGSGGRVDGMGWIAVKLAEAGFIVAGPNHPGTTSGDSTPAASPKIWERTQDISVLISALAADRQWQSSLDQSRIGILGFSLGGVTALELAGARPDLDALIRYCDEEKPGLLDCSWFRGGRGFAGGEFVNVEPFDLRTIDRKRFEQSNRDPRITAVVSVDPSLSTVMKPESVEAIDIPLALINLGSPGKVPPAVIADQLAKAIPGASYAQVNDADHYSFLPVCQPDALDFLKSVGETDPICDETARPRADIHAELGGLIIGAFGKALRVGKE